MDLYFPRLDAQGDHSPAVVFVIGYRDSGVQKVVGCDAKDMASYVSWARLAAASGLVGVTYTNDDPTTAIHSVVRYLREHADALGIDAGRIALWACSGNGPVALSVLMEQGAGIDAAVFCYAYLLDADDRTLVADAASTFGFANPCAGRSIEDVANVPLLIVRAGRDEMPGLNVSGDRFIAAALDRNLPLTVINHHTGPHAFDLFDDSDRSKHVIKGVLTFLRRH
jgi:acetyl esterase/lipase